MTSLSSPPSLADYAELIRPAQGPEEVQLLPTPRCNAACAFCPLCQADAALQSEFRRFTIYRKDLSGGLLDRLADDLYHLGGLKRLTITGGEPLLYTFLIPAVFQFSRAFSQAELAVVTNGIRLRNFAAFLVYAGVHELHVSINAGTPASYQRQNPGAASDTFNDIIEGIKAVLTARAQSGQSRPKVTLSVVLTRHSAADVKVLFELGRRLGVEAVTFIPLMEIRLAGRPLIAGMRVSPDQYRRFRQEEAEFGERARKEGFYLGYVAAYEKEGVAASGDLYRRQPCYLGSTFAAIYPNGDVRPCCHCEPVMGNLQQQSFVEIWRSELYEKQREKMLRLPELGRLKGCLCAECGHCWENEQIHRRRQKEG